MNVYLKIARIDHWFKNVFILLGAVLAVYDYPFLLTWQTLWNVLLVVISMCLISSSNYIVNEVADAPYDANHPIKKNRPVPSGDVNLKYATVEWLLLTFTGLAGLAVATTLSRPVFACGFLLWLMGGVYNVEPLRTKDIPYLDVLTESINNPIRLLAGWYAVGMTKLPPISLVLAYWMIGAFFMAVKRFAEYRRINNPEVAACYRNSFASYTEHRLLISIVYYAVAFGILFGMFIMRYRLELILSVPFIAGFIGWYIHMGFMNDSPTQYPERLYKQRGFVLFASMCIIVLLTLLYVDVPLLYRIFTPTIRV